LGSFIQKSVFFNFVLGCSPPLSGVLAEDIITVVMKLQESVTQLYKSFWKPSLFHFLREQRTSTKNKIFD